MIAYVADHNSAFTVAGIRLALSAGTVARSAVASLRGRPGLAAEHRAYVKGLWAGAPTMS